MNITEDIAGEIDVQSGEHIRIDVVDNGVGMEAEIVARIFEPFFTTKDFGQGSGLGLAVIYGFVKQSGGGIMVQSELDHGTSMSILLPKNAIATEEITTHDNDQPTISREGQLVLLVEDDSSVRQVVRKQLLELGFPVIEAASAAEAKSLINQIPEISILLTDVIMPGSQNGTIAMHINQTAILV